MFKSRKLAVVFCVSILATPVIFAESVTENFGKFVVTVRPGQVIGSMFKAMLWTVVADVLVPLVGTPARVAELSIFSLFSYHYMHKAYIKNITEFTVEKNK